jgi:hypothetical protein
MLSSGVIKLIEAADVLGYANHSGVSKRLARDLLETRQAPERG